jgi:NodT family efflux transporter outer membrane factor (OMF) lipoprotein
MVHRIEARPVTAMSFLVQPQRSSVGSPSLSAVGVLVAKVALPLLLAVGCTTVGPDYTTPEFEAPVVFAAAAETEGSETALVMAPADLGAWWERLGDEQLTALVERALSGGLDVRTALARLNEARALRGVAAGERLPSLDARLGYENKRESENTPFGAFASETDIHSLGFDASWEVDLWGRVRRSIEAADRALEVGVEDAHATAVLVAAETARWYVELRAFQRRLAIAEVNVRLQEQTLALVTSRRDAGLVGELDVAQASANLESTRSRVPSLRAGLRAAENRLAVLVGVAPGTLRAELAAAKPVPRVPAEVAIGLPADLLRQRADVRRAERNLAAETARIGVAEGDLYPRLSLFGSLGLASDGVADLLDSDSVTSSIGPSVRWNVFDAGRLGARVDAQTARAEQARLEWERTVLVALEEAENALTNFVREQERRTSLEAAATQSRRASDVARAQYTSGLTDFQVVIDSERATANLEDELAVSDAAVTSALVSLYKALGGGFGAPQLAPEPEELEARLLEVPMPHFYVVAGS